MFTASSHVSSGWGNIGYIAISVPYNRCIYQQWKDIKWERRRSIEDEDGSRKWSFLWFPQCLVQVRRLRLHSKAGICQTNDTLIYSLMCIFDATEGRQWQLVFLSVHHPLNIPKERDVNDNMTDSFILWGDRNIDSLSLEWPSDSDSVDRRYLKI